jgi:tRNA(Ile)-lysidine synthetase-like protein
MTAVSPYAPGRRNSFLRRSSSSIQPTSTGGRSTAAFALFLFAIRFWREAANRQALWNLLRRRPSVLGWIKNFLGIMDDSSQDGRIIDNAAGNKDLVPVRRISLKSTSDQSEASSLDDQRSQSSTTRRFRDNQLLIRSVLHYWFGQHSPDNSQKMLWMIAASSDQLRSRVDQEITEKFESLLMDLSASESSSRRWSDWCLDRDGFYGHHGKIAAIIVLDQFSRHIQRHHENTKISNKSQLPSKADLDALALKTAQLFVETHKDEIKCGMIPVPMYIFSLMPYRHANTIESVEFVQQCVEDCAGMNEQMDAMLGRFRKATNRRMALLQDEQRRTGTTDKTSTDPLASSESIIYEDEDILETFQFEADFAPAVNHPVHKTIAHFLEERGIFPAREGKPPPPCSPVIVSLSGGVDSMVIASVLSHLKKSCGYNLNAIAVHIDYANRPESGAEADFVRRYTESLGITFRCLLIEEITRGITARDDYERIAREMRYGFYKEAIAAAKDGVDADSTKQTSIGIMLGHHRGDLRENVLSNAHKGCGPLELSGMTAVSKNDGVAIYRPLLPLEKASIFDYAHKFGVPYFKGKLPIERMNTECGNVA